MCVNILNAVSTFLTKLQNNTHVEITFWSMAVTMKSTIFWVVTWSRSDRAQRLLSYACHLLLLLFCSTRSSTLMMEAICSSETSGSLRTMQDYNPEDCSLQTTFLFSVALWTKCHMAHFCLKLASVVTTHSELKPPIQTQVSITSATIPSYWMCSHSPFPKDTRR
jgi:hypothetical protein